MTPEQKARERIDDQLRATGWAVQSADEMDISAGRGVAVREFPLDTGFADYLLYADAKATLSLKFHHFAQIHVRVPSCDEQRCIVTVFKALDHEIELLSTEMDALKEQKKGLMQQLLTGQVRLGGVQ
ncbi:MAG: hypothetical protein ABSF26_30175 [Thermoguttaceae bacterium]|jgi:hypothetical protein